MPSSQTPLRGLRAPNAHLPRKPPQTRIRTTDLLRAPRGAGLLQPKAADSSHLQGAREPGASRGSGSWGDPPLSSHTPRLGPPPLKAGSGAPRGRPWDCARPPEPEPRGGLESHLNPSAGVRRGHRGGWDSTAGITAMLRVTSGPSQLKVTSRPPPCCAVPASPKILRQGRARASTRTKPTWRAPPSCWAPCTQDGGAR